MKTAAALLAAASVLTLAGAAVAQNAAPEPVGKGALIVTTRMTGVLPQADDAILTAAGADSGLKVDVGDDFGWSGTTAPLYRLTTEVVQKRRSLGRRIDDTASRYELTVKADWTLTPVSGGEPIKGSQTTTTTYATADQPYAAIAAQQDGEDRAAADLARLIRLDMMRALAGQ